MKRKYHPYTEWEEYKNGMWNKVDSNKAKTLLDEAIRFTGNANEYGAYMMKVISEWPVSSEQNLEDCSQNRRAWIGHAACCLAIGCPEYITRRAWGFLTIKQMDEANKMADIAIRYYETNISDNKHQYEFIYE